MSDDESLLTGSAVRYLSYRPRFSYEVRAKLLTIATQKKIKNSDSLVDSIIKKLTQKGFLNDIDLAGRYVAIQLGEKIKGPRFILYKLRRFGLPPDLIHQSLEQFASPEDQKRAIARYIERKKDDPVRLFRRLVARGFDPRIVSSLIDANPF